VNGVAAWGDGPEVSNALIRANREPPSPGQPRASARHTGSDNALEE
jgi:hypothetical protein